MIIKRLRQEPEPNGGNNGDMGLNPEPIIYPEEFTVYPNPAIDYFIIEYALGEKENAKNISIALFDDAGTKIMNFDVETQANQILIECEDWKEGVYWCRKLEKDMIKEEERIVIDKGTSSSETNNNKSSGYEIVKGGNNLKIYPNPAKDYFIVSYDLKDAESSNILILITDSRGRIVKEIKTEKNTNYHSISSSGWAKGIYTIRVMHDKEILDTVKLMIK